MLRLTVFVPPNTGLMASYKNASLPETVNGVSAVVYMSSEPELLRSCSSSSEYINGSAGTDTEASPLYFTSFL